MMIESQSCCFRALATIYFFLFLLPLLNTFASPTQSLCRRDQRDALLEFKTEFFTEDDSFVTTTSWNKSTDCCSWLGVTCDAKSGDVVSLILDYYSGNTTLKSCSGLFKLQHLRHLRLSSCDLQGEIPSSIGNLSHLTSLDLSTNRLQGELPASIGNLNRLRYMDLFDNILQGNIPTSFANLTKLSELNLERNQFTGGVIVLPNLTSLSDINLSWNHFKSISGDLSGLHNLNRFVGLKNSISGPFPSSLLMISSLVLIDLSQNQFQGSIDFRNTSLSSKLEELDIGSNEFNGLIPESISKLGNLGALYLSHNNFGGGIPRSISKLGNLEFLDLSNNNLVGQVASSIAKLVNLQNLDLSYNNLEGQVPDCLWRSSKLDSLDLSHNSFSSFGKSVVEVVEGASVRELDLSSNSLQGPFPEWICKLRDLSALGLSYNNLTSSIPPCLKNSTSLAEFNLRNNRLSGFLPDLFVNDTWIRSIDVSHNNLVGKLPKSLINSKYMEYLNVEGNKIKDTFPFWLGSLELVKILSLRSNEFYGPIYNHSTYLGFPSMRIMDISNNNFFGSLPQDYFANWTEMSVVWSNEDVPESDYMGDDSHMHEDSIDMVYKGVDTEFVRIFQAFKAIDFSGNRFRGHIPVSIGLLLSELRFLNLSGNAFTGNIPSSLANITKLEALDLSRNNLSGEIPRGFVNLTFLSYINFSHNHLQGLVPQSTQFLSQKCSSFVGNPGLYGLDEICKEFHVPVPTSQQPEESLSEPKEQVINWIAAAISYVPGVFCGLVIGHIFTSYKHEWFIAR